jgi:uncharacterized repeat protein (TIGR01451 family)
MGKPRAWLIGLVLAMGAIALCHGRAEASSERVQNPENGHWYQRFTDPPYTWHQARQYCRSLGGHLATVGSGSEEAFVFSLGHGYLGGTDEGTEGAWRWITGEPWIYTHWAPGEPNNSGGEDYLHLESSGLWNDAPGGPGKFICEWEKHLSLSAATTAISPDGQARLTVTVTENRAPLPNAKVRIEVQVKARSGGHGHTDLHRPRGCLAYNGQESQQLTADRPWIEVTTDSTGKAVVDFTPGKDINQGCRRRGIAGDYVVTARLADSPSTSARQVIVARVDGLAPFSGCVHCELRTDTHNHTGGQYATTATASELRSLAEAFHAKTGRLLSINDISLPYGGLYDYRQTWTAPHAEHGYGTAVDFNRVYTPQQALVLRRLGRQFGRWADAEYRTDGLLHLDFGQDSPQNRAPLESAPTGAPDLFVDIIPLDPSTLKPGAGQAVSYTIGFGNFGAAAANGVVLTATLPGALGLVSADPPPSGGTASQPVWAIGAIDAGGLPQIVTLEAAVQPGVTPGTVFTATSQISGDGPDTNLADNQAGFSLTSFPLGPDLGVWSDVEPVDITPGQAVTFTGSLANYGNVDAAGTVLTLTVPSQLEVLSTSPVSTSQQANSIVWQSGNLPVNQTLPVTVTLVTPADIAVGGLLTFTLHSRAEPPDINTADDVRQVVYQVKPGGVDPGVTLDVAGRHQDGSVSVGETVTYTIYYGNYGTQIPDSPSQIDFRLGEGLVLLSARPRDSSVLTTTMTEHGATWHVPYVPIDRVDVIEVFVQVASIPEEGSSAYATIGQAQDVDLTNNVDYELRFRYRDRIYLPLVLRQPG